MKIQFAETKMRIHQLKCFTTLTQTLHYTEAAKLLYLSQPSVSYDIRELEKELGVKLFEKHGRKISMTEYAKAFLPFALTAINSMEAGMYKLKEMMNPKNLRLGYIYSVSSNFLPSFLSLIPTFDLNEDLTFSFYQGDSEDLILKIQEGKLDLAFSPYVNGENISSLPIFSQEIFLVVPNSHVLAGKKEVQISEIKDEKFALIKTRTNLRHIIENVFEDNDIKPKIVFEAEECNSVASYVASEFGISLLPRISALVGYNLSFIRLMNIPIKRMIYLVWKTDSDIKPIIGKIHIRLKEHFESQQVNFNS